ncbi:MAG TPA: vWA domain-containing protein [Terracidiphilus sp.]|nr:vWA domain-containing protein [Terracidiphilus sp.]
MHFRGVGVIPRVVGFLFLACGIAAAQQMCSSTFLVTAMNQKTNQPLDGLSSSNFHAKVKGREAVIRAVAPAPQHRRIVFVLDRSGSMTGALNDPQIGRYDPNALEERTLEDALRGIPKDDAVAFLAFAGKFSSKTEFVTPDAARQRSLAMMRWKPTGAGQKNRTALWDNLDSALRMLTPHAPGDTIIVLSDGGENSSKLSKRKVRKELLSSGVEVLAMVIANPIAATPEERGGPIALFDLAKETGGVSRATGYGMAGMGAVLLPVLPEELVRLLSHQYEVSVAAPCAEKPESLRMEVGPLGAGVRARLFYPQSLVLRAAAP